MDVKIHVCLLHKYGRFMLFIDNNLLLPAGARLHILNNITKFIKYEKPLRKEGKNMLSLPINKFHVAFTQGT